MKNSRNGVLKRAAVGLVVFSVGMMLGGLLLISPTRAADDVQLTHIHGMAYSGSGEDLVMATHFGLAAHAEGGWRMLQGPAHDFMGFSGSERAFYTSGHPGKGSPLKNPLGLMKSSDGGATWLAMAFAGETDFHVIGAGFFSGTIYAWLPSGNSRLPEQGYYLTTDEGKTWRRMAANGLSGYPRAIAVHPAHAGTAVAASSAGVFLSTDHGERFQNLLPGAARAVFINLEGTEVWASIEGDPPKAVRIPLSGGAPVRMHLPDIGRAPLIYFAQNPKRRDEIAIATFTRSVYVTSGDGQRWRAIALKGKTLP